MISSRVVSISGRAVGKMFVLVTSNDHNLVVSGTLYQGSMVCKVYKYEVKYNIKHKVICEYRIQKDKLCSM